MLEKEETVTEKNNEISTLGNVIKEAKEMIDYLSREIKDNNERKEAIIAENEILRMDGLNKTITILRCTEAVRKARDQMIIFKREREENNLNMDRMEKKHKKEIEIRDE